MIDKPPTNLHAIDASAANLHAELPNKKLISDSYWAKRHVS